MVLARQEGMNLRSYLKETYELEVEIGSNGLL
jgi:hypothetical protein